MGASATEALPHAIVVQIMMEVNTQGFKTRSGCEHGSCGAAGVRPGPQVEMASGLWCWSVGVLLMLSGSHPGGCGQEPCSSTAQGQLEVSSGLLWGVDRTQLCVLWGGRGRLPLESSEPRGCARCRPGQQGPRHPGSPQPDSKLVEAQQLVACQSVENRARSA